MFIKYLVISIILSIILTGCSFTEVGILDKEVSKILTPSKRAFQSKNLKQAIDQLESINNRYPFSPYVQQIQLDLIYLYYKNADFQAAQTIIDRFIHLNPIHPNIDYVIYMSGLIKIALDNNKIQDFFNIDRSSTDPQYALDAFHDFSKIVHNYPNSKYFTDATRCLFLLKNRLAKHEFLIADYYMKRGAWIAVVNRIKNILSNYPDTQIAFNGLKLMEKAYRQMQMDTQADKIEKIITFTKKKDFN